ncbi:MAG: DUF1801 domain-containing protein [Bacteroidetes bacterium]|nr:DUF1801 domain-containing protein [Bacteroidota bacterium]
MQSQELTTKPSEPDKVDTYIANMKHPLKNVVEALQQIILETDKEIGEEVKWNAPAFFYLGPMRPFDPKEYKRHLIVFNLYQQNCIRLVFPSGAKVDDGSGKLLEGNYTDGRRLAMFRNLDDVAAKKPLMQAAIKKWLELLDK